MFGVLQELDQQNLQERNNQEYAALKISRNKRRLQHLQELRSQRDELQQRLDSLKALEERCALTEEDSEDVMSAGDAALIPQIQESQLDELLFAYRLTGVSATVVDNRHVRFCFDTSHMGHFYESYHVEVELEPRVKVTQHTLPLFAPLKQLETRLKTSIRQFICEVQNFMQAFVWRRQEAVLAQREFAALLDGEMQVNHPCDCITFTFRDDVDKLGGSSVLLKYTDLKSTLPSQVSIDIREERHRKEYKTELTGLFASKRLSEALQTIKNVVESDNN